MMKLILMIALIFISEASMAQKVVDIDGKAVIDNRAMPAKAITTDKKARTTDGGIEKPGADNLQNIGSEKNNRTVSHYFEVMKTDYNNGTTMNWLKAIQNCEQYDSSDSNKWRLPTQRELQLIWILHVSLIKKVSGFTPLDISEYWSATEYYSGMFSWHVNFNSGSTSNDKSKTFTFKVRCVRDLTPPLAK